MTPLPPIAEQIRNRRIAMLREEIERRQREEFQQRLKSLSTEKLRELLDEELKPRT